jgi:hypothetical protein
MRKIDATVTCRERIARPPDHMEKQERRFLDALAQVIGNLRYVAGLVMTDARGNAILHFVERPE